MRAIEGVFFDLDGTLLDTAADFVVTVNQMLSDHQQPPLDAQIIRQNVSNGSRRLMQLAFNLSAGAELEHKRALFLDYYDHYISNPERATQALPYPGIRALLAELDRRQIVWGVVTNKPRPYALPLMQQVGLMERCHAFVCPEDVQQPKPDPQALYLACQQANCNPGHCIYIGDHGRDIEAGKRAGMVTVAAHYGYIGEHDDPLRWQADCNINAASDLQLWLEQLNWQLPTAHADHHSAIMA